ncbi:Hypothetical protein A7982_10425 [Minicystis rosea]|nr:Hypothetical protein A7982_10425 [Minicystis rosea]
MRYDIHLPDAYHELNTPARGYLEGIEVRFDDGSKCVLTFLDDYNREHYGYYFEGQNVVIVEDVTQENIESAIARMAASGELDKLKTSP